MTAEPTTDPREAELAALRAHVAELEAQLAEQTRTTARLVADAQEKLYWLERWHIDLDRLMARPGAIPALNALRRVRQVVWWLRVRKRRLLGG
ncbi:MAG TPA: hypothetical protein VFT50_06380 [Baekduia sp.]|nr:hypothetical protein [Baekduia sp.]